MLFRSVSQSRYGASGKPIRRAFCPTCGSQMFGLPEIVPDMISIRAGTLDDPNLYQPQAEIFVSHANQWDMLNPELLHFEKMMRKVLEFVLGH